MKNVVKLSALVLILIFGTALATTPKETKADAEIKQILIKESLARYPGNCPCPYNVDRAGRRCGKRSAYSRPGGASPLCFTSDISDEMVREYRKRTDHSLPKTHDQSKAKAQKSFSFTNVEFIRCRDGDTCLFTLKGIHPLFGRNIPVRLAGVDSPEKSIGCLQEAEAAKHYVTETLQRASNIQIVRAKRGKYYRIVADVIADGVNLNKQLLKKRLVLPYTGKSKPEHPCQSSYSYH